MAPLRQPRYRGRTQEDALPRLTLTLLLAGLLAFLAGAGAFWFVTDDAWISFRYARHLAEGHGLRFNLGEQAPVEGYSNFLWVVVAAAVHAVGGDVGVVMPALSLLCGALLGLSVARTAREALDLGPVAGAFAAVLAWTSPWVVVWATGGLATLPAALALLEAARGLTLSRTPTRLGTAAALTLALLRTEGALWVALLLALRVVRHGPHGAWAALRAATAVALPYAAYTAWRWAWFGTLVSAPALAKVEVDATSLVLGARYAVSQLMAAPAGALALALTVGAMSLGRGWRVVGLLAAAPFAYAVLVGGDFMAMGRLLVPAAPFLALGAARVVAAMPPPAAVLAGAVLLGGHAAALADLTPVPVEVRKAWRFRFNTPAWRSEVAQWRFMDTNARRWGELGEALAAGTRPGESLVLGAIGAASFPHDLHIYDQYGLVTREVAARRDPDTRVRSPGHQRHVPVTWFLDRRPTYLYADLVAGPQPAARIVQMGLGWRQGALRGSYAPDVRVVKVGGRRAFLVLLARADNAGPHWRSWRARAERAVRDDPGPAGWLPSPEARRGGRRSTR